MSFLLAKHFLILPVCFYAFATLLIISALMVVFSKHPVQSALYLVLAFFASSALWIMAQAEFLGLVLILVYVGAVMTLFLFVVMTVPFSNPLLKKHHWLYLIVALTIIGLIVALMAKTITPFAQISDSLNQVGPTVSNTQAIGAQLYTQYLFPFELAGLILLVAIIAAISLSAKYNRQKIVTNPSDQIKVTAKSRLKIIKMAAEIKTAPPVEPS